MSDRILKILVNTITSRTKYTFDFVFEQRGISYELLTPNSDLSWIDLNYSDHEIPDVPTLKPSPILAEEDIRSEFHFNTFAEAFEFDGRLDYFASIFVTLTRMEEYGASSKDQFGRFPVEESVLFQNNILDKAMCDRWADKIFEIVKIDRALPNVEMQITFDIDNAYAYKYKSGMRRNLSYARDVLKRDNRRIRERKQVEQGVQDPYDTYDAIEEVARRTQNVQIFWLVEHQGKFDRNIKIEEQPIIDLIQRLTKVADVGIHPSFSSFGSYTKVLNEKEKLEQATKTKIYRSRQHFLRFQLPETYEHLMKAGITDDFSLGFAGNYGFRCGTARSVKWFNLRSNAVTDLTLHPFVYMDGTLNEYMSLSIEESKSAILKLYKEIANYGGTFRCIWHNETIGDYGKWKGWQEVLNFTIDLHYE